MAKEAYYFSHDYDPTGDPKMGAMLGEYGGMGYGCFWRIVEMLHSDETHRLPLKKYIFIAIAKQMLTSSEIIENFIKKCIEDYELLQSDGQIFWSNRVDRNLGKRAEISEKRANAGRKGGLNKAIAKQKIAIAKQNVAKERKGKELKVNKNIEEDNSAEQINDEVLSSPEGSDGIYPACMNIYNDFVLNLTGVGAKIDGAQGNAMKAIIAYLKTQVKNKENLSEEVPNALKYILANSKKWDTFTQNRITLTQINSNLLNIINAIKNGTANSNTKQPQSKYAS